MPAAREQISRRALLSFATNYNSAPEAIMELVDNPIDYRGDRKLNVQVDVDFTVENPGLRENGAISIRDWGGQGMDIEDLRNWLRWGEGESHEEAHIGQFHVGGKLAAIYLAESLKVTCRRAGDRRIWHFSDEHWGSRTEFVEQEFRELGGVSADWINRLDPDTGFVQVMLNGIKHGHFTIDALRTTLTDVYETLLENGDVVINVNGSELDPYTLPWMSGVQMQLLDKIEIMDGVYLEGKVGAINRRGLTRGTSERVLPGIRTDYNGRKITAGEMFGVNLQGRGRSQRVFGEISISGPKFKPNQNKTGWDLNSAEWAAISRRVKPLIQQVVRDLEEPASAAEEQPKTAVVTRSPNALSFNMKWLNDDGPEELEANQIIEAASAMNMLPKEWMRHAIRLVLAQEADNSSLESDGVWDDDADIVQ